MSDRIQALLDRIKLSRRRALPAALLGSAGVAGLLSSAAKADTAFTSFGYHASHGTTNRTQPDREYDVINVLEFGADPSGSTDSTSAIQAAVDSLNAGVVTNGSRGKIYFPPGSYKVSAPGIQLPLDYVGVAPTPSIIIEGAGTTLGSVTGTGIFASPPFNGFIFDDLTASPNQSRQAGTIWIVRDIALSNPYKPPAIYPAARTASGAWNAGAPSINVTSATGIAAGVLVFNLTTFAVGNVPGYVGFVAPGGISGNTLTFGNPTGAGMPSGAQIPSSGPGTGTADNLPVVQGFYAASGFTKDVTTAITMAATAPTLDNGLYYVWDWTQILNGNNIFPTCVGITSIGVAGFTGWTGTTLNLTAPASVGSVGAGDLLVLSPISGCIRHTSTILPKISNCTLHGIIGAMFDCIGMNATDISSNNTGLTAFDATIENVSTTSPIASTGIGGHGLMLQQSALVLNCDITGSWVGVRMNGVNGCILGGRLEVCAYGVALGHPIHLNTSPAAVTAFIIADTETEGCWICNIGTDTATATAGTIMNIDGTNSHQNATYGMYFGAGITSGLTVISSTFNSGPIGSGLPYGGYCNPSFQGKGTPCCIYLPDTLGNSASVTFIGVNATSIPGTYNVSQGQTTAAWHIPTRAGSVEFVGCNNPPPIYTFSNLPIPFTLTGQITDGSGGSGIGLQFTSGSVPVPAPVGSAITGTGVSAGTFIVSHSMGNLNQVGYVNKPSNAAAGTTLTVYPMNDGDEYLISDSQLGYLTTGTSNVGKVINSGNTGGAGTNHVKVRWDASQLAWILV